VNSACSINEAGWAKHLPFPGDCTKFCKCDHGGAKKFDCPSGLHFNAVLEVCDWPDKAACVVSNTYVGTCVAIKK